MFLFLLSLVGVLVMSDIPAKADGPPNQNPSVSPPSQHAKAYATAFYWEMYGAYATAQHKGKT